MPRKKKPKRNSDQVEKTSSFVSSPTRSHTMMESPIEKNQQSNFIHVHSDKELKQLQEMFNGQIESDVVQLVLSECSNNVNLALEVLMNMVDEEDFNSVDQAAGPEREAPAVYEDLAFTTVPEKPLEYSQSNEIEDTANNRVIPEVGGIQRENNRISFIDIYSNEVYGSNEDLYKGDTNEHSDVNHVQVKEKASFNGNVVSSESNDIQLVPENLPSNHSSVPFHMNYADHLQRDQSTKPKANRVNVVNSPKVPTNDSPKPTNQYWNSQKKLVLEKIRAGEPVFVVLRGIPGSGKTTLANQLRHRGVVLSTDNYFMRRVKGQMVYNFNPMFLGEAHEWNRHQTEKCLSKGQSPVIIDNTNTEIWEMKPYLALGIKYGYSVFILEPTTPWKFKARELTMKNSHSVQRKSINRMLDRYENKHPNLIMQNICKELNLNNLIQNAPADSAALGAEGGTLLVNSGDALQDYKKLSLQELMSVMQDSDCSKSGPDDCNDATVDIGGWESITEHDQEFSWTTSKHKPAVSDDSSTPSSPAKQLKSCLKKSENPDSPSAFLSGNWGLLSMPSTPSNDASSNDGADNTTADDSQASSRRRRKKKQKPNLKLPLIDDHTKTKLSSENWVLPKFPTPKAVAPSSPQEIPKAFSNAETVTLIEDFVALYKTQNNLPLDGDINVKVGSGILQAFSLDTDETPPNIPAAHKLDKSCMTDQPPPLSYEEALESLTQMFPSVPQADLADILEKCHGNHSWAVNILLDSGTDFIFESMASFGDSSIEQNMIKEKVPVNLPDVADVSQNRICGAIAANAGCAKADISLLDCAMNEDQCIKIKLDAKSLDELRLNFGPDEVLYSAADLAEEDLSIEIPSILASQIYAIWQKKISAKYPKNYVPDRANKINAEKKAVKPQVKINLGSPLKADFREVLSLDVNRKSDDPVSFKEIMEYEKAVEMSRHEQQKKQTFDMSIEIKQLCLREKYPHIDQNALDDLFQANGFSLEKTISAVKHATGEDPAIDDPSTERFIADCEKKINEITLDQNDASESSEDISHEQFREMAQQHKMRKHKFMNQAAQAHSKGMSSAASYYSRQGHIEGEKVREMNELAANCIIEDRNARRHHNELDLHGLFVSEAISTVQAFISAKRQAMIESHANAVSLHIITGRGNHSEKGVSRIRKAVISYLKSVKITFVEIHSGLLQVRLSNS